MHKLDLWLLNKLDALTMKLQRKGYRLTELYVQVSGIVFVSNLSVCLMGKSPLASVFVGSVWGVWLLGSIRWANNNRDYPESVKMMERLNAWALKCRKDEIVLRYIWIMYLVTFNTSDLVLMILFGDYMERVLSIIGSTSVFLMVYLHGCFYIGPGHFAKDTQTQLRGDEVLDN